MFLNMTLTSSGSAVSVFLEEALSSSGSKIPIFLAETAACCDSTFSMLVFPACA